MNFLGNFSPQFQEGGSFYWLGVVIGFVLILIVGFAIKNVGERLFNSERTQLIWSRVINWVIVFAIMVYIFSYLSESNWMYQPIFELGGTSITPILLLVVAFAMIIAGNLSKTIREYLLPSVYKKYDVERSIQATVNTLLHYTIIVVAFVFSLNSLGLTLTSLTVFAGVLGVGIGFGLQNIMSNFISGLIILFDRPIKVGDRVIIEDTITDIEKIKLRHTIVHTRENERMIIPNSYFLEEKFINRSYSSKRLRVTVELGVTYGANLRLAEQLMVDAVYELQENKWQDMLSDPDPKVFIEDFADYNIPLRLFFWIDDQSNELEFTIPSDLRVIIYDKFNQNNVPFSFPRQDVRIISDDVM